MVGAERSERTCPGLSQPWARKQLNITAYIKTCNIFGAQLWVWGRPVVSCVNGSQEGAGGICR